MASTRIVRIGDVEIGGDRPVAVQSMTNTRTKDVEATVSQINLLEEAGCEIVRVGLPDRESVAAVEEIKGRISIPLVADVHFHADFAIEALKRGADKVRINPGNIGSEPEFISVLEAAGERGVAVRIGVNSGSLHRKFADEPDQATALVKSCIEYVKAAEKIGFTDLVLSVKSSTVMTAVKAYRRLAKEADYPLHLGITEAGTLLAGAVKSSVGLGVLLAEGIGDTIRVSLTADPVREVQVAQEILRSLGLRSFGPEVIACPTCARQEIDIIALAEEVEKRLRAYRDPIKVVVMGCPVNGPGEASEADVGIAGGRGAGIIYREGKAVRRVSTDRMIDELFKEIDDFITAKRSQ
ncbi:MAG: flavodoxin-dependent (E)-4-hydroxy-3-methylbut-2-enyl-diphosphate synthase [Actinobacteria bacterium]|nr:flavodoxin-dependent (E)-4-hydroxy-3-methylbut-2-enyl-diphosphate synthase [Actinomycetota bacterium]